MFITLFFRINVLPQVITGATNGNAARWWKSIPEGRQMEAEEIGPVVAEFIKLHQ
ncbi:MAG: hypothetical protein SGI96_18155 [Bacteroidota bacterium]|nr:hypothetical protein [Bacteroidota bacterium]